MSQKIDPIFELILVETVRDFSYDIDNLPDEAFIEQLKYNAKLMRIDEVTFKQWISQAPKVTIGSKPLVKGTFTRGGDTYLRDAARGVYAYGIRPIGLMARDAARYGYQRAAERIRQAGPVQRATGFWSRLAQRYRSYIPQRQQATTQAPPSGGGSVPFTTV